MLDGWRAGGRVRGWEMVGEGGLVGGAVRGWVGRGGGLADRLVGRLVKGLAE